MVECVLNTVFSVLGWSTPIHQIFRIYRDKIEHKDLVIHIIIMCTDLLYFYNFLLNPKNIKYLITLELVGKHT